MWKEYTSLVNLYKDESTTLERRRIVCVYHRRYQKTPKYFFFDFFIHK